MPKSTVICYHVRMKNVKRIAAIIMTILLVGMYAVTLVMAITDDPNTMKMFGGCVLTTIFVPLVAYVFICMHRYAMNRSKRSDPYSFASPPGNGGSDDKPQ